MTQLQTGETLTQHYWQVLSPQLQKTAAQCDLDTVETEELMLWAFTVTEIPSQSIAQVRKRLMSGWKDSDLIMSSQALQDGVATAILQAQESVRYAAVIRRPKQPAKVVIYLRRR